VQGANASLVALGIEKKLGIPLAIRSHRLLRQALRLQKLGSEGPTMNSAEHDTDEPDAPLPATLTFVMTMGTLFLIGWFVMFWLLRSRF
jgi:hypothetical protein